jgi:U3 small nucleolar RNA-associated protein 4
MMSFWEREIQIWRLDKASEIPENGETEPEDNSRNRKLVAKILIKGEANISSAALNADGTLLAVSTIAELKVFELKSRRPEEGTGLRISQVTVPSRLSGARLVEFSPDGKWLGTVRQDSHIVLARLLTSESSTVIHPHPTKLSRINRQIEKRILLGGLGSYDRTVTQIAFSSDSRILAVSDLAGYIDTWVLSGSEDLTQPPNADTDTKSDFSDSESELDSEHEAIKLEQIFGQAWARSPSATSIPKLPSTPTVLSFRPSTSVSSTAPNPIPTRNNPNPIAHDLPSDGDRLLVVTSFGDIYEFEVLKGALSPWSRRNPTSRFPEDFRKLRDQARGCIWDVSGSRERVWLFGIAWLWMFDLRKDFLFGDESEVKKVLTNGEVRNGDTLTNGGTENIEEPINIKKRKRNAKEFGSGAGNEIPSTLLTTGISRQMQMIVHQETHEEHSLFPKVSGADDMDIDENDDEEFSALEKIRRVDTTQAGEITSEAPTTAANPEAPQHWRTFKYRPILGVCVVGERKDGDIGPEIAIVERPIRDVQLGPRYVGNQEWDT